MKTIGVDIGGTSLRVGLVDENGEAAAFERVPQGDILNGDSVGNLARFLSGYIGRSGGPEQLAGIAVGLPATLDKAREVVFNAPNIDGFNGKNVAALLREALPVPVYLLKDVEALFHCDVRRLALPPEGVMIACYVGTGIGNVISIDGKILGGSNGAAGELGHIPVWDDRELCTCGNPGCMETLTGGKYLARLQRESFPQTPMGSLFAAHGSHPLLTEYVRHLALPVATEINLLDPVTVILGGGVLDMDAFPLDTLVRQIRFHARKPLPEKNLRFVRSVNDGRNGVTGAGLHAWDMLRREK